jgi:hypothetical protein
MDETLVRQVGGSRTYAIVVRLSGQRRSWSVAATTVVGLSPTEMRASVTRSPGDVLLWTTVDFRAGQIGALDGRT